MITDSNKLRTVLKCEENQDRKKRALELRWVWGNSSKKFVTSRETTVTELALSKDEVKALMKPN